MNGSKRSISPVADEAPEEMTTRSGALDIWQFSADVSNRLMFWNSINIAAGILFGTRAGFPRGVASQNVGWGIINIAIAVFGKRAAKKRFATLESPYAPDVQARDTRNLRLLLAVNGLLDVLYMFGGWRFARAAKSGQRFGVGTGIVIQGLFLFIFDWRMFRRSFFVRPRESAPQEAA